MASDDVIELGSSDEESEPAPKRRKPPPNAMVHIPSKLPAGVTVTPLKNAKSRINPACIVRGSIGQAVTVTKIKKTNVNPFATNKKLNGNPVKPPITIKPVAGVRKNLHIPIQKSINNPGSISVANSSHLINPCSRVIKTPCVNNLNQARVNNLNTVKILNSMPGKSSALEKPTLKNTKLPPCITVKRTCPPSNEKSRTNAKQPIKHFTLVGMSNTQSKPLFNRPVKSIKVVPTVNLDDDEPTSITASGPQWYLRPEDQNAAEKTSGDASQDPLANNLIEDMVEKPEESQQTLPDSKKSSPPSEPSDIQNENNKEPDKTNYIEITIEDSPIKPTKKGFKVGAELAITVDDSPVKIANDKAEPSGSDKEDNHPKERQSKKKLEYPKTVETVQVVEIEFEPPSDSTIEKNSVSPVSEKSKKSSTPPKEPASSREPATEDSSASTSSGSKTQKPKHIVECIDIVEIEESPIKPTEEIKMTTPKKNIPTKPAYKMPKQIETIDLDDKDDNKTNEFSSIYQSFINLCFQLENSDDMKKIVEKKIKAYYRQVPKEYTESETFTDMVAGKIMAMKAGPEKMYLYIKDVVDELNLQRKMAKAQPAKEKEEQEKFLYGEDSEFDAKRQRQIRKLEKTLKKLHRAIQKLEEQEVDFDDEEDSVYLLTESEDDTSAKDGRPLNKEVLLQRYKERSVRVHAKLCQLTNTKMPSEARVQIDARPGQPRGPAKRLEKWINRKVPIGTPLPFPDFHDVLRCVRDANQEDMLGWNEADVMEEARDLFVRCGKKLQRRRQENEWRLAASRIPTDTLDPAEDSADLKRKLEENKRLASKKETDVFNKYADRQNQLNLEAVEIGDKEAEESPVESDDEEPAEVTDSLTNKEKRKERLKRLLQEKSKVCDNGSLPTSLLKEGESSQDAEDSYKAENVTKDNKEDANKDEIRVNEKEDKDGNEISEEKDGVKDCVEPEKEPPKSETSNKDGNNAAESDSSSKSKSDSKKVDSDVDELHLLEKLYSDNEYNNSVVGSTDTGSPIAISDSTNDKTSGDERSTNKPSRDVISIENSSYSESEEKKEVFSKDSDTENSNTDKVSTEAVQMSMDIDTSVNYVKQTINKSNNEECNGLVEDVLLASSDEAYDSEPCKVNSISETCINLKDDNISIGETLIIDNRDIDGDSEASRPNSEKNTITDSSSVEGMEIGPIELNSEDQSKVDTNVETVSIDSLDQESTTKDSNEKTPESNEEGSSTDIININSVETIETDNGTLDFQNMNATSSVKSIESVDGNIYETEIISVPSANEDNQASNESVTAVDNDQGINDDPINEVIKDVIHSIENSEKNMTDVKTKESNEFESKGDSTIHSCEDTTMKEVQDVIKESTDESNVRELIEKQSVSEPEAMEVDSINDTL